jgi:hypothetical protein
MMFIMTFAFSDFYRLFKTNGVISRQLKNSIYPTINLICFDSFFFDKTS